MLIGVATRSSKDVAPATLPVQVTISLRVPRLLTQTPEGLALALPGDFEVVVLLTQATATWLLDLAEVSARIALRQPTWERLTESADHDVDLRAFFAAFTADVPVEDVPRCIAGDRVRARPKALDTAMLTPEGRLEIFRYARRYVRAEYWVKSLRCKACVHATTCRGLHVNHIRAHGFAALQPVLAADAAQ